ncbi:hypothetical protein AB0P21_29720 [Kribbella sp. NPDC056861]|uniref:hypothetical protein n=1 Tax=Kribbella sp. NPDC056861 TaxID=3154857 RepID=UPI0034245020
MSLPQQQDIARQLVESVEKIASPRGQEWATVKVTWSEVDGRNTLWQWVLDAEGKAVNLPPFRNPEGLSELRAAMADPERGAWWAVDVEVARNGTSSFHFHYDDRLYWHSLPGAPYTHWELFDEGPTAKEFARDLELYPRSPEHVPAWVAAAVAEEESRAKPPSIDLDAAFGAVGHEAPEALSSDIDQPGWPELWTVLRRRSEQIVRNAARDGQLDLSAPIVVLQEDVAELVQFVTEETVAEAVDPLPVAQLRALVGGLPVDEGAAAGTVGENRSDPAVSELLWELHNTLGRASAQYLRAVIGAADQE